MNNYQTTIDIDEKGYSESTQERQLLFAAMRALNIYRSLLNIRNMEGYMLEEVDQTYKRLKEYFNELSNNR